MSEFFLAVPFVLPSSNNNQPQEKRLYNSSRSSSQSLLRTFLLYLMLILKHLSNQRCYVSQICSHMAFRSVQSNSPRLGTDSETHDNVICDFHRLVRTLILQKQLQKLGETLELFLFLLRDS